MRKNVLVISGSPRKGGNSDVLCDQFIKGAKEAGHSVEKVYLRDNKIGYCMACYACRETHKCIQNDDGDSIVARMMDANVIAMSTPVYFYAMAGQMKTMIDRTLPHWTDIEGKSFTSLSRRPMRAGRRCNAQWRSSAVSLSV